MEKQSVFASFPVSVLGLLPRLPRSAYSLAPLEHLGVVDGRPPCSDSSGYDPLGAVTSGGLALGYRTSVEAYQGCPYESSIASWEGREAGFSRGMANLQTAPLLVSQARASRRTLKGLVVSCRDRLGELTLHACFTRRSRMQVDRVEVNGSSFNVTTSREERFGPVEWTSASSGACLIAVTAKSRVW